MVIARKQLFIFIELFLGLWARAIKVIAWMQGVRLENVLFVRGMSEWSIGIYAGTSPLDLLPHGRSNPVLTARDVTDVPAAFVADPFMIKNGPRWYMFFEVFNVGIIEERSALQRVQTRFNGPTNRSFFANRFICPIRMCLNGRGTIIVSQKVVIIFPFGSTPQCNSLCSGGSLRHCSMDGMLILRCSTTTEVGGCLRRRH